MRLTVSLVALVTLTACAPTPPTTTPVPRAPTTVSASFNKTWTAAIDEFTALDIRLKTIDKASGVLATDPMVVFRAPTDYADCGNDMLGQRVRPGGAAYNAVVTGDSTSSTVHISVAWALTIAKKGAAQCVSTGVWEDAIEHEIQAKAEGRTRRQ
jgi:hypothetical protein